MSVSSVLGYGLRASIRAGSAARRRQRGRNPCVHCCIDYVGCLLAAGWHHVCCIRDILQRLNLLLLCGELLLGLLEGFAESLQLCGHVRVVLRRIRILGSRLRPNETRSYKQ